MRKQYFSRAQASIEMVFGLIMVVLMVFAVLKVALWAGLEMAEVQLNHDATLTNVSTTMNPSGNNWANGPMGQIDPVPFHKPLKIDAVWNF